MLPRNSDHFAPPTAGDGAGPYVALRLLATTFGFLAVLVLIVGGVIAVVVILGSIGAAGAAARVAAGPVTAGIAGAGLLGGVLIFVATALEALLLWAAAQAIRVLLSIEGHGRETAGIQRAMLGELRRIGILSSAAPINR